jgi:hypothetical protein
MSKESEKLKIGSVVSDEPYCKLLNDGSFHFERVVRYYITMSELDGTNVNAWGCYKVFNLKEQNITELHHKYVSVVYAT